MQLRASRPIIDQCHGLSTPLAACNSTSAAASWLPSSIIPSAAAGPCSSNLMLLNAELRRHTPTVEKCVCLGRGRGSGYYHMLACPSLMIRALHTVASGSGPSHIKVTQQSADPYSIPCIEGHGSHVRRLEGVIMSGATLLFIGTGLRRRSDVSSPRLSFTGNTVDTSFLSHCPMASVHLRGISSRPILYNLDYLDYLDYCL